MLGAVRGSNSAPGNIRISLIGFLFTCGMEYFTMEADCQAYILAKERTSVPMCERTHMGEKPFECNLCEEVFTIKLL